jgi:quinol monooxygenase YgiN
MVAESACSLRVSFESMASHSYIVAADFHIRADAIDAMKKVIAEVTAPSLDEEGCQIYHWSQSAEDPTLFLLYMEWRDKASFEAHIATTHVKQAEERLKHEKMLSEPSREWHFFRL